MALIRIYHPGTLQCGDTVMLTAAASHHLLHVLRVKTGTIITLFNGQGGQFDAEITTMKKRQVAATLKQFIDIDVESPLNLHLGQAISKGERIDWVVQKAVELGIKTITPVITARCPIKLTMAQQQKRWTHWQRIAESACEQCGRNCLPSVNAPLRLATWLENLTNTKAEAKLVLDPNGDHPLSTALDAKTLPIATITLLIGPEGGLTTEEIALAKSTHFISIRASQRILRTETAAIAALAAMQTLYGDF
ncbi:MAG: 16S rRNA (uracil(1498)-N(3))-methyltransferase [Gammaproteobacteria bacterium]|nr:16S rRNA (uracil(1498)-N(3))-methyltransferase [Gammaproteobacteria bacterium]